MQEIYNAYIEADRKNREEREKLMNLIRRHQKKLEKFEREMPGWYNSIVEPMAEAISKAIEMPYEIYGPFGLSCHTSVYYFVNGTVGDICKEPTLGLTVYPEYRYDPDSLIRSNFFLLYDTGERTRQWPEGTIGELNDGNVIKKPLPDKLEDIIQLLRRSH